MAEVIGLKQLTEPNILSMKVDKYLGGVNTPEYVASDMVDIVYKEIENRVDKTWRFLNICCKTGVYLKQLYFRLLNNKNLIQEIPDYFERRAWILKEMLFGICPSDNAKAISSLYLYGFDLSEYEDNLKVVVFKETFKEYKKDTEPEINCLVECRYDDYAKLCKNKLLMDEFVRLCKEYNINTELSYSDQVEELKRAFEKENFIREGKKMKFDVVIGNPPYNNDIYLEFVTLGHNLADKMSCWITPAKWQAKGGERNDKFRENIVPYMREIVMYKDSTDIFSIEEWGGIAYYLMDHYKHNEKNIKNVCTKNSALCSDIEKHNEKKLLLMPNSVKSIVDKLNVGIRLCESCNFSRFTYTSEQERGHKYTDGGDNIAIVQGTKYTGGYLEKRELKTVDKLDKFKVITSCMWGNGNAVFDSNSKVLGVTNMSIAKPNEVPKGSFIILKYFDTEEQCKSFISFMYSKVIAFCVYLGLVGATLNKEFWRFVPDPGAFDHIFTDQELYTKYGLTDGEINIIESVIKERK